MGLKKPAEVPSDDNRNTIEVICSDKLNNKLSNKPDADLAEVVQAWRAIRADSVGDPGDRADLNRQTGGAVMRTQNFKPAGAKNPPPGAARRLLGPL